jgi:hypothetical protein
MRGRLDGLLVRVFSDWSVLSFQHLNIVVKLIVSAADFGVFVGDRIIRLITFIHAVSR